MKNLKSLAVGMSVAVASVLGMGFAGVQQAHAGLVAVVADVNAAVNGNLPFYENVLGGGTSVLF
jgi:hypothetical protein